MLARLCAFVIWALVAASVVFWGLRLLVRTPAAPAYAVAAGDTGALRGDLSRLLGTAAATAPAVALAPAASSRFRLLGIVAPRTTGGTLGVALIAVDGKMPKAYAVGARLDADLMLQSVSLRTVSIAPASGAPAITLELPPPAAAATGTLPVGVNGPGELPPAVLPVPQYVPPPAPLQAGPRGATNPAPGGLMPRPETIAPTQ